MSRIPIKSMKALGNETKQDIVIVFAVDSDGETTHVATWGRSNDDCSRAADWGNRMKDKLGWPESLHAQPSRVRTLQKRVKDLERFIADTGVDKETLEREIGARAKS